MSYKLPYCKLEELAVLVGGRDEKDRGPSKELGNGNGNGMHHTKAAGEEKRETEGKERMKGTLIIIPETSFS
ncbi:unnamed protein product [Tuber melanosporum]|uniref:(Perigord truffle) hypothetical protein n=1 Tax=Tuber melanosporum (strain Mel28) TaxID=656061 RepID=D5GKS4_TUBMM|nr:uncharacterized protein GSTUM_00009741001 [Tuber melanosporum]CAZ85117.1 unnamed protein product [Tuber melanosporum]